MLNYEKAQKLAQAWINLNCEVDAEIIKEATITKSYGWIFFYQSKEYIKTQNFSDMLVGNAPILVERFDGELRVFGTALPIEKIFWNMKIQFLKRD